MRVAAGILMIIGGLGTAVWIQMTRELTADMVVENPQLALMLRLLVWLPAVVAFVGAYCTFKRKYWGLALTGATFSATGWPFIFGLLAIIFVLLRRNEFRGSQRFDSIQSSDQSDLTR